MHNASLPDCLDSCAEQLQAKSCILLNPLLNMSTTPGEAFINCCVWFRLQIGVEDIQTASVECCMHDAERQSNSLGEQQQTEKNQRNCCINSRLLTNYFYNVKSEARDCDLSCNSVPPEGKGDEKGLGCSCFNYMGSGQWQRSPGLQIMHLPTECGTEVCYFRMLEDMITNARNNYIKEVLDGLIWSNITARQLLIEVLLINNIDSQLAQLQQHHPPVPDTNEFMVHLYRNAAAPFHLASHVRRDDGGMYFVCF